MGIAQGYGRTAGGNSLIFAYDTGDTRNSYIGEPTTNLINPASLGIYSWWTRAVQTLETLTETYYGNPIYRLSLSLDTDEQRDYARSSGGAGTAWYAPYITYSANTAYIASAIYRPVSHSDMTVKGHPSNIGGWGLNFNDSIDLDNGWKRHRIDRNYGATVGDNKYYHLWAPTANTGDVLVIDITCNQIEQNDHLTPFVNGTRDSQQGLLDIGGNSIFDLGRVSFDSSAQIRFDGTDDKITATENPNFNIGSGDFTIEVMIYPMSFSNYTHMFAMPDQGIFALKANVNDGQIYFYSPAFSTYGNTPGWTLTLNQWNHVVLTRASNVAYAYLNGQSKGSPSGFNTEVSASDINIGWGWGSEYTDKKINVVKFYNRALTSDEVANNYRHYKTRFNI